MWVLLAVVILVGAVSSRFIFAMLGGGSETALVISGAQKLTEASEVDLSGGRLRVAADTIAVTQKYPWGIGVQNVIGKGAGTASGVPVIGNMSASAPFMWLLLAGVPGLLLLLAREGSVCLSAIQAIRAEPRNELLWQAYVCVVVQNVSYGTWMTASYFLVAAAVVASTGAWRKLDPLYFQTGGAGESGLSTASA